MMRSWRTGTERREQYALRAAQYLRMSTEHQIYSTENQAESIAKYAKRRGLRIVRTYKDDGKSGLHFKSRPALKQLIADAQSGSCDFNTILVYDVSRWGRFQDVDESAYYEFVCKEAGITIHYCAEPFANDGSMLAALIKSLKRAMAAEYSRELSEKVFAGQCANVLRGYRQGGPVGYGLRRLLVDPHGKPKFILRPGERKGLMTDRVILVPGLPHEVALVRRIYSLFLSKKFRANEIADLLTSEGILRTADRRWSGQRILEVLKNEKYIGNNIFNRRSRKLYHKKWVNNPSHMWVRVDGCFEPIVDAEIFYKVRQLLAERSGNLGNQQYMLDALRSLLAKHGRLTAAIVDGSKLAPCSATYCRVFGGLMEAYQRIGYKPTAWQIRARKSRDESVARAGPARLKAIARETVLTRKMRAKKKDARRKSPGLSIFP